MADVIDLHAKRAERDLIWVCRCGSTTHYLHADSHIECGACGHVPTQGVEPSGWREKLPEEPETAARLDESNFKIVPHTSAEVFLRRQIKADARSPLVAVVAIYADGGTSTWAKEGAFVTNEQQAWARARITASADRFTTEG